MINPLHIGNIPIGPPVMLAPMAGITSWPMRMICRRYGAPFTFTEMAPAAAIARGRVQTDVIYALRTHPDDRPLGIQLFGAVPAEMAEAARRLSEFEADVIDINMGCPVRKIVGNGAGAALMKDLSRARRMIGETRAAVKVPLTVKTRLGWCEDTRNVIELARICEGEGVDALTVHGRTRARGFAGDADLGAIARVVEAVDIPIIGNGGIMEAADAVRMLEQTGCAGIMVARGARGNPWIFRDIEALLGAPPGEDAASVIPPIPMEERASVTKLHFQWMLDYLPERKAVVEMRKHLSWYSKGVPRAVDLRRRLQTIASADDIRGLIGEFFAEGPEPGVVL